MAEKKTTTGGPRPSRTPRAEKATKATKAETKTAAKATAAKATAAKATAAKKPAPGKRAVARPVTRVVRQEAEREARPEPAPREKREKPAPRPIPTAPAGHAPLIAADGSTSGSFPLPAAFAAPAKRFATLFQAFLASRANARQGTAATKNRSRVSGGGAKPWRQKGTGRARQGSTRSPHWRHGGVVFGPNGRSYAQRIPEKMRRAAFAEAMSARAAEGRLLVVEDLKLDGDRPRTRDVVAWLGRIGDTGATVLVWNEIDEPKARAMANLQELSLRTPGTLRLADVLESDTLLVQRGALDALVARGEIGAGKAVHA